MRLLVNFLLINICFVKICLAQNPPVIQWQNTIGGDNADEFSVIKQTNDGGYILGGSSVSGISGDKTDSLRGVYDYWVIKVNALGLIEWQRTLGGSQLDGLTALDETSDNGFIIGGYSWSDISGEKTDSTKGIDDFWLLKLDSVGNILWQKTIGGSQSDELYALQQTADGGYILGGASQSTISGDKTDTCRGGFDYWVVKLDSIGGIQWQKTMGGDDYDILETLEQTSDRGYILIGESLSNASGDKTENSRGFFDYWIVKLDSTGTIQWQKTIGGNDLETPLSIKQTTDVGYIIAGDSYSNISGDKTVNTFGGEDFWVIKIDSVGSIQWQQSYGGFVDEACNSARQTPDGGYILGGSSSSGVSGNKTESLRGGLDYWIIKTDSLGTIEWQKAIGGSDYDALTALELTNDGGYILGGYSRSPLSFDKTENCIGLCYSDYWIIKLSAPVGLAENNFDQNHSITISPNPAANHLTITLPSTNKKAEVTITTITGEIIYTTTATATQKIEVDTKDFADGMYVVRIQTVDFIETKKLVVAK